MGWGAVDDDPYGLASPDLFWDPHQIYHLVRYAEPVHWSALLQAWMVTRYDDVSALLSDRRLATRLQPPIPFSRLPADLRAAVAPIERQLSLWAANLDDSAHERQQAVLNRVFAPAVAEQLRPQIRQIAHHLIDRLVADEAPDIVTHVARPFPIWVSSLLLGFDEDTRSHLGDWLGHLRRFVELGPCTPDIIQNALDALAAVTQSCRRAIDAHRQQQPTLWLAELMRARDQRALDSDEQLLATCVMIMYAGHDATTSLIASSVLALLQAPDQLELLQQHAALMPGALAELARFEPPVMRCHRVARVDLDLARHRVHAGQHLVLATGAANRDPARFTNPDRLDSERNGFDAHLAFGAGPHACPGRAIALVQVEIVLSALLERLPGLHLARQPHQWREHFDVRGLRCLPVGF